MTTRTLDGLDILFVDDHLVVVNKPSGLLVHSGWGAESDVAMFRVRDLLGAHVYPVHRLDRGASGALVFARTRDAAASLAGAFEMQQIDIFVGWEMNREYAAITRKRLAGAREQLRIGF